MFKFLAFLGEDLSHEELENFVNCVKELNGKAQNIIDLMFNIKNNISKHKDTSK